MTKVSLRAYNHEIEGLIEHSHRLDEAVAHCRHILETYPKHLETYRLLGKAYLEAKRYDQAIDIFQRVLVAAPKDFVSHVGMSIIADDRGKLDDAIWHMERAFEVQPSNAAIQAELQRLFGRRDGVEPPKIRLTRGALAHMYVQGELFAQAISEIQAVLGKDPNRPDMQELLALAYFRSGRKAEAADVCEKVLAAAPFCLEANRLLAEIVTEAKSPEAAQDYKHRVFELDPYAQFAGGDLLNSDTVADGAVTVDRLDYMGPEQDVRTVGGAGMGPATGSRISQPSWMLHDAEAEAGVPPGAEPADDNLEFVQEGAAFSADVRGPETVASSDEFVPAAVPGDLPAWVKALAPADGAEAEGHEPQEWQSPERPQDSEQGVVPMGAAGEDEGKPEQVGSWVPDLGQNSGTPQATGAFPSAADSPPTDSQAVDEESVPDSETEPQDDLAWLEALAEKPEAVPDEPRAEPGAPDLPKWLSDYDVPREKADDQDEAAIGEKPFEPRATLLDESAAPMGSDADPQMAAESPDSSAAETPSDWLKGLSDSDAFAGMEAAEEDAQPPMVGAGLGSDWPRQTPRPKIGEEPSWLGEERAAAGTAGSGEAEYDSATDLPAWLADLDKPEPAADLDAAAAQVSQETAPSAAAEFTRLDDSKNAESEGLGAAETEPDESVERRGPLPSGSRSGEEPRKLNVPSLAGAQAELARGNIAAALALYEKLIRKGKSLEDIIRHLRDALYRYPVEVPIWQSLGDAYMRANRLQEALDAYTKAEELLR